MSTFTNRNKSVSGSRKNRKWHNTVNQRIDDTFGSQNTMLDFSSDKHNNNVSTSTYDLTLPITTDMSDVDGTNLLYDDSESVKYKEFMVNNGPVLKTTQCDEYMDDNLNKHIIQQIAVRPQDPKKKASERVYLTVDKKAVPFKYRNVLVDRNMATNDIKFLTPTSLENNFIVNNEDTKKGKISPYGYFEYYDGVVFRLFYSTCYNGWNVATNYLSNGDKYVMNNIKLGKMFMEIFDRTPDIASVLDINSIYYFVFSHPYTTYDPAANIPRVIFLARQSRTTGYAISSRVFDGKRVEANNSSTMMFKVRGCTITIVQRTAMYHTVSVYTKNNVRSNKNNKYQIANSETIDTANPFSNFAQRYLTTMSPAEVQDADTQFLNNVPRYRAWMYDLYFSPCEKDIENVSDVMKMWIDQYHELSSDNDDYPGLTQLMYHVLREGLKDFIDPIVDFDIYRTIKSLNKKTIIKIIDPSFNGFSDSMYNMPYSLLLNLFIEFYGTFMQNFIDYFNGSNVKILVDIKNSGSKYIKQTKQAPKKLTTVEEISESRDMWA